MKVIMKAFEKLAIDYSSRFKPWDFQCIAKDAYLSGYRRTLSDAYNVVQEGVEVEFKDGTHQLTDDIKVSK